MTDLTVRIEALEARGYELSIPFANAPFYLSPGELQLLTALEQAQAWSSAWRTGAHAALTIGRVRLALAEKELTVFHKALGTPTSGHFTDENVDGRLREIVALESECASQYGDFWKQRAEQAAADAAMWKELFLWSDTRADKMLTIGVARLKLAERRNVALRREIDELYANDDLNAEQAEAELSTLKEIENRLRAELAAERAKRCSITSCSEWTARKDEA